MLTPRLAVCSAVFLLAVGGCRLHKADDLSRYETVPADPSRDTEKARALTAKALALLKDGQLDLAEPELKAALAADLFHGPAHNNLGILYYKQEKYYRAAWEFQYAAKLMPDRPEPKNNLGMVMEAVGRLKDAAKHYQEALALAGDSPEYTGNLARCRVRLGQRDEETRKLLQQVVLKDTREEWVKWARMELIRQRGSPGTPATTSPNTQAPRPTSPSGGPPGKDPS